MGKKKSQMEIMGLVVIVLLIMLGLVFALRFMTSQGESDVKAEFEDTQLAANMLNAMLRTSTNCSEYTVTTLLQDCVSGQVIACPNNNKSCEYSDTIIKSLLKTTIKERMSKRYELTISKRNVKITEGGPCTEKVSKFSPISIPGGTMIVKLDICTDQPVVAS